MPSVLTFSSGNFIVIADNPSVLVKSLVALKLASKISPSLELTINVVSDIPLETV